MEVTHYVSLAALTLIALGLALRRRAKLHMALMTAAFLVDLGLLLYIEFTRQAVEKALGGGDALLYFHIAVSVGVLVLYVLQIRLGLRIYRRGVLTDDRGQPSVRTPSASGVRRSESPQGIPPAAEPRRRTSVRARHRQLGVIFVVLRLLNFVTSFYV